MGSDVRVFFLKKRELTADFIATDVTILHASSIAVGAVSTVHPTEHSGEGGAAVAVLFLNRRRSVGVMMRQSQHKKLRANLCGVHT